MIQMENIATGNQPGEIAGMATKSQYSNKKVLK
jgi:hypothetical protein